MFQIPNSDVQIWTLKKEENFITITCNQIEVYKYDYVDHSCTKFNEFMPRIKFPKQHDTASIMYKIVPQSGKATFE